MNDHEPEQLQLFDTTPYEAPRKEPDPTDITCLFLVIINKDGGSQVVLDPNQQFRSARLATAQDVYPALANILADWTAMKQAEATITFQAQAARKANEARQAEEIRRRMNTG
jgi:hypothetical protein